ncbi:cytochrome P450 [Rhodococcus sp. MSC1_016]|jgi:cytochrome P450|uniref:cytochrome P450 n=1 Tax=Rhodococcus sp. MSC1_016 TaxID=2909266 RepID=UPI00202F770E|nr:cytochrome P450 [Rhodococcus sp. MSC1_016]
MTTTNTGARNDANSAASYRPSTASDLYSEYDRLRASSPVVHSDDFDGFWSVLTFADASKASRDWKNFASGRPFVEYPSPNRPIPIATNPPEHTFYRTFLNRYFRPDRVARLSPEIDHIVAEQLTPLIEAGEGDIYRSVARTVPPQVLSVLLGLSDEGWVELAATLDRADSLRHDISAFGALQATLWDDAVNTLIADRTEHPRDPEQDVMSGILELRPDGEPISREQVLSLGTQIFAAGADTTSSAMGSLAHYLATNPDDQARLRADPDLLPAAIEEVLRLGPPLHQTVRRTTADVTIAGTTVPANELVAINVASANRDAERFADPHRVRLDRDRNQHLTFGFGPHMCVGAPIARQELLAFGTQLLAGTRSITLAAPAETSGRALRTGWSSIPLRLEK